VAKPSQTVKENRDGQFQSYGLTGIRVVFGGIELFLVIEH